MSSKDESEQDPTRRFANRVEHYVRHRPGYPRALIPFLHREAAFDAESIVADVGSGTGILSRLFLAHGNAVFGVEPNAEMRAAAESELASFPRFTSVDARAENTGLAPHSIDLVAVGQAFHWFRPAEARSEFTRVLRAGGQVVLIWNTRRVDRNAFQRDYEALLLEFGTDYREVDHRNAQRPERLDAFFGPTSHQARFDNAQVLDWAGLQGRLLSSSYVPAQGDPRHDPMLERLRRVFDEHQENGAVTMGYDTEVYYGPLPRG